MVNMATSRVVLVTKPLPTTVATVDPQHLPTVVTEDIVTLSLAPQEEATVPLLSIPATTPVASVPHPAPSVDTVHQLHQPLRMVTAPSANPRPLHTALLTEAAHLAAAPAAVPPTTDLPVALDAASDPQEPQELLSAEATVMHTATVDGEHSQMSFTSDGKCLHLPLFTRIL